ncbi:Piso0_004275 [Millerozyma farinosa CBS 7064]|uniref:Piso0_004275 protein n=1 Tax=Pichia sorbitophila (strain ATCC MYA-4447 / BCRC 22081 / CBS 7064 / NBRC 10061 / NRRL Y-12695) TaxID=559304 RepID=G8Y7Z1_PICSO|nr:Piso0_004275 [Millerozyma farinosa CBS 7064]CCE84721.1 Piso0_004275 [Millerozyma farinosa CBS 7064]
MITSLNTGSRKHALRWVGACVRSASIRYNSSDLENRLNKEAIKYGFFKNDNDWENQGVPSNLPFEKRRHSETFGQLVRSDNLAREDKLNDGGINVIAKDLGEDEVTDSPYRNKDGSFKQGENTEESRISPETLLGRIEHRTTELPQEIATAVNNHILRLTEPDRLREKVAILFRDMTREQIQHTPEAPIDCDAHIAAFFLQDYSNVRQVLLELQKRVGAENFKPRHILDIGYGPSTGIVALNEVMGDDFFPETKDSLIVSKNNFEMKKRAKIILSRQVNEIQAEAAHDEVMDEKAVTEELHEEEQEFSEDESDYVGPVDTSQITLKTKLRDTLPSTKSYDLIIVNQALLSRVYNFPRDVDDNLHEILKLLSPGGHLVLVERGNALGFETIARARQVMLRPESYEGENGKIPRPYVKGSTFKPQKNLKGSSNNEGNQNIVSEFEQEIIDKYGEVDENELAMDFENPEEYEVSPLEPETKTKSSFNEPSPSQGLIDYHLSVVAPCPHHGRCPLQLGDPSYYKIPSHKHRFNFCSFDKKVMRPTFTTELKKGKRLALPWDTFAEDGFGLDKIPRKKLKALEGSGRSGSNNIESGSYSYLIMERSNNNEETLKKIETARECKSADYFDHDPTNKWPRIISNPTKVKNNVKLHVCSPSQNIEIWSVPKSMGKQHYYDARKANKGDLWALGRKSVVVKNRVSEGTIEKLDFLAKSQKKKFLKDESKKQWKKLISASESDFVDPSIQLADELATSLEQSKKYKVQGKRAKYSVNPTLYDGK